jgi:hypothetical protein
MIERSNAVLDRLDRALARVIDAECRSAIVGYRIALTVELIAPHVRALRAAERKIIEKYAKRDDQGQPEMTPDGTGVLLADPDKLEAEMIALHGETVSLPDLPVLTTAEIQEAGLTLTVREYVGLSPLLSNPE